MGLMLLALFSTFVVVFLIVRLLFIDLSKFYWIECQNIIVKYKGGGIEQLITTLVFCVLLGFGGFAFYKCSLTLLGYLLSKDLIEFFIRTRGVFTNAGVELQNPLLAKNIIYGAIGIPILQCTTVFVIIESLKLYMHNLNEGIQQEVNQANSLVFLGAIPCFIFLLLDVYFFLQSMSNFNAITNAILLIGSKLSILLFFFGLLHLTLNRNGDYNDSIHSELNFGPIERRVFQNNWLLIISILVLAIILNIPLYSGFQFGISNGIVLFKLIITILLFYFILKKVFTKGLNYLGVYLLDNNRHFEVRNSNVLLHRTITLIKPISLILSIAMIISDAKLFFFFSFYFFLIVLAGYLVLTVINRISRRGYHEIDKSIFKQFIKSIFISSSFIAVFLFATFTLISLFPKPLKIEPFTSYQKALVDDDNKLLFVGKTGHDNPSIPLRFTDIPNFFVKCLLLREDKSFYKQDRLFFDRTNWHGISLNFLLGRGGSNINQQLIKNLAFNGTVPQELQRKFSELIASYNLSISISPEKIIEHYVNNVTFNGGRGHTGLYKGSYYTFGRSIKDLNELEMLYLILTLSRGKDFKVSDQEYIPFTDVHLHPDRIKAKILIIAEGWYDKELITKKEIRLLRKQTLRFTNEVFKLNNRASKNIFYANKLNSSSTEDHVIKSGIKLEMSNNFDNAISQFYKKFNAAAFKNGYQLYSSALAVDIKSGQILGHYGGDGEVDLSNFLSGFQVGSLIKPFVIYELLDIDSQFKLYDGKLRGRQTPRNHNRRFSNTYVGTSDLLKYSLNAPFSNIDQMASSNLVFTEVENKFSLMNIPGDKTLKLQDPKYKKWNRINYPLGTRRMTLLNIAQMYQALLNNGKYVELKVVNDSWNAFESSTYLAESNSSQIYRAEYVRTIKSSMSQVMTLGGTANQLVKLLPAGKNYMAKTGTTDGYNDGYTLLSDGKILIIAWLSYGKNENGKIKFQDSPKIPNESGGKSAGVLAAYIYNNIIQ